MASLDKFIQALYDHDAEQIVFATGEPVLMCTADQQRPLTTTPATANQLQRALREIAPGAMGVCVSGGGRHQFSHLAPAGPVRITVTRRDGQLKMQLEALDLHAVELAQPAAEEEPEAVPEEVVEPPVEEPPPPPPVLHLASTTDGRSRLERLLLQMVEDSCSDLHLCSGNPPMYRKDGDIVALGDVSPLSPDEVTEMLWEIAPPRCRQEFEKNWDADFAYEIPDVARFRCNIFMDRVGMGAVFRLIPSEILTAEQLRLPPAILELCELQKGLVVVTGPTGSGKSTTLAAMIDYINRNRSGHIITIEDPVEFVHPNKRCLINQREIGSHTRGFKQALRAALREDPDIVLVGEMRDLETVEIALETAETGHLVFGTLHTNTAPSTVDRIIDQFPSDRQSQIRTMLSEALKGVVAQTLCKKKGGGRVAALETLMVTSAVANLIREGKSFQIPSAMQTGKEIGMMTMNGALLDLVRSGVVTPQEAVEKAISRKEMKKILEDNGLGFGDAANDPPGSSPVRLAAARAG